MYWWKHMHDSRLTVDALIAVSYIRRLITVSTRTWQLTYDVQTSVGLYVEISRSTVIDNNWLATCHALALHCSWSPYRCWNRVAARGPEDWTGSEVNWVRSIVITLDRQLTWTIWCDSFISHVTWQLMALQLHVLTLTVLTSPDTHATLLPYFYHCFVITMQHLCEWLEIVHNATPNFPHFVSKNKRLFNTTSTFKMLLIFQQSRRLPCVVSMFAKFSLWS